MPTDYAGNPNSYPESVALFDDTLPPTGSNINPMVQAGALDRTAWLRARINSPAAANWWPSQTMAAIATALGFLGISGGVTLDWGGFTFSAVSGQWLAIINWNNMASNQYAVIETPDGGRTWALGFTVAMETTDSRCLCAASAPTGSTSVISVIISGESVTPKVSAHAFNVTSNSEVVTALSGGAEAAGVVCLVSPDSTPPIFVTYYTTKAAAAWTGHLAKGDIATGATWTDLTSDLPIVGATDFESGTGQVGVILADVGQSTYSGSLLPTACFAIAGKRLGTDPAYLMVMVAPGGGVFNPAEVTSGFLTATGYTQGTFQIAGVAFDQDANLCGVAVNLASGDAAVWVTSDFVHWTQVYASGSDAMCGLAVVGGIWMLSNNGTGGVRILYSCNVAYSLGASTWSYSQTGLSPSSLSRGGIFSAGSSVLAASDTALQISLQVGFP
jgi:hypothetical protein